MVCISPALSESYAEVEGSNDQEPSELMIRPGISAPVSAKTGLPDASTSEEVSCPVMDAMPSIADWESEKVATGASFMPLISI